MTILDRILKDKKAEVAELRRRTSFSDLEKSCFYRRDTLSLSQFITDPGRTGIIAEFKRRSPSGGILNRDASPGCVAKGYADSGASGLSILTDYKYFGGSCDDLREAREINSIPVLRKDFIIDEIQVTEAKAAGADAILLIAAALERERICDLSSLARSLGMEIVFEIHDERELEKINEHINITGINNRNLKTMITDTEISVRLAEKIPQGMLKISESGISDPATILKLRKSGFDGFLVGETFMRSSDPSARFREFVEELKNQGNDQD